MFFAASFFVIKDIDDALVTTNFIKFLELYNLETINQHIIEL